MAHFLIAQVKVNDDSWIPDYAANVHEIVHRHGGKYLSRSGSITTLEGAESTSNLVAVIEFPTEDDMNASRVSGSRVVWSSVVFVHELRRG